MVSELCFSDLPAEAGQGWPRGGEMVGITLEVQALQSYSLDPHYAKGLHAWFLSQVEQTHPRLSAYLHDGESEKPFTLSRLMGPFREQGGRQVIPPNTPFQWSITGLNPEVVDWLWGWSQRLPAWLELRGSPLQIRGWKVLFPPRTYSQLLEQAPSSGSCSLSFVSPTSFRHRGHHLPLPVPKNLFHSYLRRWNDFSGLPIEVDLFLDWVDREVTIQRYRLESVKTTAGRQGSVTGFIGCIQLAASPRMPELLRQQVQALLQFAPYCGTGHKTTFGLGQTRLGWLAAERVSTPRASQEEQIAERIQELSTLFLSQRQRQGGSRAEKTAWLWATILARRESGESLEVIAKDLEMPYETVKTYAKLARRATKNYQSV
ncbi:CRISPR-associated endoribonuclease Cas6 [Thermostichus vulcanus]|uniref:CRISPR-associated endoribonuclease Cas6 n=1 Tax=Thermostichus vulcanus str. 'Rupite' TaxID=2813851 RepID=A0ABT0C9F0_THEVL|nr:CRISPR-associated endoribonuclease Cas6 [Thermostichus vulcanus]MCJ2542413.1 CRISPR-associated endoribonuclease Cas6 [Thermostichus vulcanus str. 'Rupite']